MSARAPGPAAVPDGVDAPPAPRSSPLASATSPDLVRRLPRLAVALARRNGRARRLVLRAALRLERGDFRSATARDVLEACCGVAIGAYSYGDCFVPGAFPPGTRIGRYVSIAEGVRALGRNHPMDRLSMHPFFYNAELGLVPEDNEPFGGLEIGSDVWLGLRAILTPGCRRVGHGAVVAAGSVVTRDVPDFGVVAGVPARVIRHRFPADVRAAIRRSRWWDLPVEQVARHLPHMTRPLGEDALVHPLLAPSLGAPEAVLP